MGIGGGWCIDWRTTGREFDTSQITAGGVLEDQYKSVGEKHGLGPRVCLAGFAAGSYWWLV